MSGKSADSRPVRVIRNTGVLLVAHIVTMGTGLVWVGAFARYVGPSIYGLYNYGLSVMALLALVINFGIEPLMTRNIAREPERAETYVKNALFVKLVLSFIVLLPFWGYGFMNWDPTLMSILIICGVGTIMDAIAGLLNSALYAFENMAYEAIGQSLRGILLIAFCFPLIRLQVSFVYILWISVSLSSLKILICYYGLKKQIQQWVNHPAKVSMGDSFSILKESLVFAVLSIIGVVYSNVIILLIRLLLKDDSALGYFAAAQRIYLFALVIPGALYQAIYPVLSRTFVEAPDKFAEIFEKIYRYLLAIAFPLGVAMAILAPLIINLIYGERFAPSVLSLRILSLGLLNAPGFVMGAALSAMNKQGVNALVFGLALILLGVFCYVSIPLLGIEGACWGLVVSNLIGLVVYSILLFQYLALRYPWWWLGKVSMAAAVTGLCILVVPFYVAEKYSFLVCSCSVGIITYILCLITFKAFSATDARLISSLFPVSAPNRSRIERALRHNYREQHN